ncbi:RING-H2 finger protein ATL7-like isoform X2 [Asparagus officinalis]|uniref:RING-H2 finger protein ATL7-like isoform X2 n=1 Tax=Asparagus officinalis TaxID=4686 RepID=UPI00098E1791|nr:RING-H2 finger protein ATL7-like isoform X2 [Asparagus officinalis]
MKTSSFWPAFCSTASPELKLYQAFIFSVPVFFTFILLLLFWVFYLRRRRASWQSMRMRASNLSRGEIPRYNSESGIKKEVREMLPVVVFKESFLIRETQCSVCLGDYQPEERLQRIPSCGHTFHIDCIDHWLVSHATCPLCRVSLLPASKISTDQPYQESQTSEPQLQEPSSGVERTWDDAGTARQAEETGSYNDEVSIVINIDSHGSVEDNVRTVDRV